MIELRFKDLDPDQRGRIQQDALVALCTSEQNAKMLLAAVSYLYGMEADDPNRVYYLSNSDKALATYDERIWWIYTNYFETGLEYESMLRNLKDTNLEEIKFYDGRIGVPKLAKDMPTRQ